MTSREKRKYGKRKQLDANDMVGRQDASPLLRLGDHGEDSESSTGPPAVQVATQSTIPVATSFQSAQDGGFTIATVTGIPTTGLPNAIPNGDPLDVHTRSYAGQTTITQASTATSGQPSTAKPIIPEDVFPESSSGLSTGAKIGIGVSIPIVFLLFGLGIFLFLRRKKQQRMHSEKGDVGEVMIIGGKHHDDEQSSGGITGSPEYAHPVAQGYAPPTMQNSSGYEQGVANGTVPVAAPVSRRAHDDDDLMNRPVSPVHDDDLLTGDAEGSVHTGRAGTALGGSIRDRGSPTLDDDREMQWILEEERKAKERREQQGRLPTHT